MGWSIVPIRFHLGLHTTRTTPKEILNKLLLLEGV